MFVIIDHDETYTAAPVIWDAFIIMCIEHGHTVVCCTLRQDDGHNDDIELNMGQHEVPIVYAADYGTKWEAMQCNGYQPENAIWIDDQPGWIL
jgi:hypothetical protein